MREMIEPVLRHVWLAKRGLGKGANGAPVSAMPHKEQRPTECLRPAPIPRWPTSAAWVDSRHYLCKRRLACPVVVARKNSDARLVAAEPVRRPC